MPSLNLHVALDDAPRPVTRLIDIPSETTLHGLHLIVQAAFGWENAHMHLFSQNGHHWSPQTGTTEFEGGTLVAELLGAIGDTLTYTYDLGDQWVHTITLLGVDKRHRKRATLKQAEGLAPIEGIGGVGAWAELLEDIDLAAAGRWDELADLDFYNDLFGRENPLIVKAWVDGAHDYDLSIGFNAVKKVDPTAEPVPRDYRGAQPDAADLGMGKDESGEYDRALSISLARGLMEEAGYSAQEAVDTINEKITAFSLGLTPLTTDDLDAWDFDERPARVSGVSIGNPIASARKAGIYHDRDAVKDAGQEAGQDAGQDEDGDYFDPYESGWNEDFIKEPTPFDGTKVPRLLFQRAERRGVLRAIGDYFGQPLLNEMITLQEQSSATFNDNHAALFGSKIQGVYAIMLGTQSRPKKELALAKHLNLDPMLGEAIHVECEFLFLTIDFLAWNGSKLIPVTESEQLLDYDPATFAREMARRMPADRGEHYITSIIALLFLAYGDEAARSLGQLRDRHPLMEIAEFYKDVTAAYFPHLDPEMAELGALQEIFRRLSSVRDGLLELFPTVPNPLLPEQQTPHPTLVAFVHECLSHLDPQYLLPETQEGFRDYSDS